MGSISLDVDSTARQRSPATMASLALRRLQKEFSDFPRDNPNLRLCENEDIQDLTRWKVKVVGAKDTIYEGEEFCLQVLQSMRTLVEIVVYLYHELSH